MTHPLLRLCALLDDEYVRSATVIHGGEQTQRRGNVRILPWSSVPDLAVASLEAET